MAELLDYKELASILHISERTLRNRYAKADKCKELPPRVVIPGVNRVVFSRADVDKWIANAARAWGTIKQPSATQESTAQQLVQPVKRGRGRPTKAEQFARAQAAALQTGVH